MGVQGTRIFKNIYPVVTAFITPPHASLRGHSRRLLRDGGDKCWSSFLLTSFSLNFFSFQPLFQACFCDGFNKNIQVALSALPLLFFALCVTPRGTWGEDKGGRGLWGFPGDLGFVWWVWKVSYVQVRGKKTYIEIAKNGGKKISQNISGECPPQHTGVSYYWGNKHLITYCKCKKNQKFIGICNFNRIKNVIMRGLLVLFSISVALIECWLWFVSKSEFWPIIRYLLINN